MISQNKIAKPHKSIYNTFIGRYSCIHKEQEESMGKKFKDLDLSNAFLFAAALEDPQTWMTFS